MKTVIGEAMYAYLIELLRDPKPTGVPTLARRTGRARLRKDRQYGPAHRLVAAGLASWVEHPRKASWRALEPTPQGYRVVQRAGLIDV